MASLSCFVDFVASGRGTLCFLIFVFVSIIDDCSRMLSLYLFIVPYVYKPPILWDRIHANALQHL